MRRGLAHRGRVRGRSHAAARGQRKRKSRIADLGVTRSIGRPSSSAATIARGCACRCRYPACRSESRRGHRDARSPAPAVPRRQRVPRGASNADSAPQRSAGFRRSFFSVHPKARAPRSNSIARTDCRCCGGENRADRFPPCAPFRPSRVPARSNPAAIRARASATTAPC